MADDDDGLLVAALVAADLLPCGPTTAALLEPQPLLRCSGLSSASELLIENVGYRRPLPAQAIQTKRGR